MTTKSMSLHSVIHRAMFLIAAMPIVLLGLFICLKQVDEFKTQAQTDAVNSMNLINERIQRFNDFNEMTLQTFVNNPLVQNGKDNIAENDEISELINAYLGANDTLAGTYLGLDDGRFYNADKVLLPPDYDPRNRPWYIQAIESDKDSIRTAPYKDAGLAGDDVITYARKVYVNNGEKFIGVAGVDVEIGTIRQWIHTLESKLKGTIVVMDTTKVILATNKTPLGKKVETDSDMLDIMTRHQGEQGDILEISNQKFMVFSYANNETGWIIFQLIPWVYVELDILSHLTFYVIILIALLILISLMTSYLKTIIISPVEQIVRTLDATSDGDYLSQFNSSDHIPHEFERIHTALNNMRKKINTQTGSLIQKEEEITAQYEEINTLYEETTELNEIQDVLLKEIEDSYGLTIRSLSNAIEANDLYTRGHCERVRELSIMTARNLGCTESDLLLLDYASLLHDVGKLGIPHRIINKRGKLDDLEYQAVQKHPQIGYRILKDIPYLKEVAKVICQHHERIDGKGYPNQIKGDAIHFLSRILSVADAFDAMTSVRPYRNQPLPVEKAYEELLLGKRKQFDHEVVNSFIESHQRLAREKSDYKAVSSA